MVIYVSEHCAYCEQAVAQTKRLAREFGVPCTIHSVDAQPVEGLPAVPAVRYKGVIFIGVNLARRLRLALMESTVDLSAGTVLQPS